MLRSGGRPITSNLSDHLDAINAAAERLEATSDGLLRFCRACAAVPDVSQVDVEAVADVAAMLTRPKFPSVDLLFIVGPSATVLGDGDLLLVALQELIANAVAHRRQPDVAVVSVSTGVVNGRAVVRVADQGRGVDPRFHDEIFEPLRRVDAPDDHRGVGMGLAIASAAARALGGTLVLESSTPEGSVFALSWPQVITIVDEATAG